jgi:hypothetical protein
MNENATLEEKIIIDKMLLSKDDVVVLKVPHYVIDTPEKQRKLNMWVKSIQSLLPFKNKMIVLDIFMDISIISKSEVEDFLGEELLFEIE